MDLFNSSWQLNMKSGFQSRLSKVINKLLWFMIASLSDWFKVLAPLFQPIRSKTKTNRGSCMHIFLHFVSATCNYLEF